MATHLGRNPFEKKTGKSAETSVEQSEKKAKKGPAAQMDAAASRDATSAAHSSTSSQATASSASKPKSTTEWLFVDLPAKSFVFALKTVLLVKEALDKKA